MNRWQRLQRSARVATAAAQIFAGYRWLAWRDRARPPEFARERLAAHHRRSAERIFDTATELQGLLIKVGQVIGARADVVPDEYIEVLSRLHDTVPPHPFPRIRAVIERELGAHIDDVFSKLGRAPIAAASLAQVHRGRLLDGREVAVKVQYPEIDELVETDLRTLKRLGQVANRVLRDFDFAPIVEELTTNIPLELDFINEGRNAELAARNFADEPDIIVPKIYWEHTTRRVLTMEFLEGIKITDMAAMEAAGIDKHAVSQILAESYVRQIFAHGFFHADPHPGNLFVRPGPQLIIVDFGLAKELPPGFLKGFVRLMTAIITSNSGEVAEAFRDLGFRTRTEDDGVFEALGEAMVTRLARNEEFNRDRELLAEFQDRMLRIFRENPVVRVPGEFLYIGRVMGLLAGLGAQLGSNVNLLQVLGAEIVPARSAN